MCVLLVSHPDVISILAKVGFSDVEIFVVTQDSNQFFIGSIADQTVEILGVTNYGEL